MKDNGMAGFAFKSSALEKLLRFMQATLEILGVAKLIFGVGDAKMPFG